MLDWCMNQNVRTCTAAKSLEGIYIAFCYVQTAVPSCSMVCVALLVGWMQGRDLIWQ